MNKFRRNIWMYGIIGAFVGFAALMLSFAYVARNNRDSLVITDYYKAEIEYQQQIDKMQNLAKIGAEPIITMEGNFIKLQMPNALSDSLSQGSVSFYRANNAAQDLKMSLEVSPTGAQLIDISSFEKGLWKLSIDWTSGHLPYFYQKSLTLH